MSDRMEPQASVRRPRGSVFSPTLLQDVVEAAQARFGGPAWRSRVDGAWHHLAPPDHQEQVQGWKLHVSATPLSAAIVLAQSAPVLLEHGCAFKFAATLDRVAKLTEARAERSQGGKFLTAYPGDDERFRLLAEALDQATRELPGPAVLSDRLYRPGSLVSYRFGAFRGVPVLTDDGQFEARLLAPDGKAEKDSRQAWFSPPAWAVNPFPAEAKPGATTSTPSKSPGPAQVLISGRFAVRRAIRHAYRGGVFVAVDQETDTEVVLKQCRPHVGSWFDGRDLRDSLRHEATMLARLPGVAPEPVGVFEHEGNLFLAEELIPGETLTACVKRRRAAEGNRGPSVAETVALLARLVELLASVHERGIVCRDFTPGNIMVTPQGSLRLIDVEHAMVPGTVTRAIGTPGYVAPEQVSRPSPKPAPGFPADLYSLGAIVFFVVTGALPVLPPDDRPDRPAGPRLSALLERAGPDDPAAARCTELVRALTAENPEDRWSLDRVRAFLARLDTEPVPSKTTSVRDTVTQEQLFEQALNDGLGHLLATMTPDAPHLWPDQNGFAGTTDPCNVQHGAAGVLGVLVRAAEVKAEANRPGQTPTLEAVRRVADWILERVPAAPRTLPGLYFGRSGTAWALHSAAVLLDDDKLRRSALDLARSVPVSWPNPDVCHGLAGAGLALVHLLRTTGDPEVEARAHACADAVIAGMSRDEGGIWWEIPRSSDSVLAGTSAYGFAHGSAGIGAFLLAMGCVTDRADCLKLAAETGRSLIEAMEPIGSAARWPAERGPARPNPLPWSWCNGTGGIGTFLIRLWQVTGDEDALAAAERAAVAVYRDRWNPSGSVCHGTPGSGELLMDLAEATGEQRYRDQAAEAAACLVGRHGIRDGRTLPPDASGGEYSAGYQTGLAGALGLLLRVRDGGPRLWMPDEVLTRATALPEPGFLQTPAAG